METLRPKLQEGSKAPDNSYLSRFLNFFKKKIYAVLGVERIVDSARIETSQKVRKEFEGYVSPRVHAQELEQAAQKEGANAQLLEVAQEEIKGLREATRQAVKKAKDEFKDYIHPNFHQNAIKQLETVQREAASLKLELGFEQKAKDKFKNYVAPDVHQKVIEQLGDAQMEIGRLETERKNSNVTVETCMVPHIKHPFVLEIPGKIHESNEDSHYARVFKDVSGTEWGLSLTADGLSGYGGLEASHLAINVIRSRIEDTLCSTKCDDTSELIKSAILEANRRLDKPKRPIHSTLDLILMREKELYLAHMGDGRIYFGCGQDLIQVTTDEEQGGIPINYLGGKYLHHDPYHLPTEERIHLVKVSLDAPDYYNSLFAKGFIVPGDKVDEKAIKAALSTPLHTLASMTDGCGRVPPARLKEILTERGKYHDRRDSIAKLSQMDEYLPENLSTYDGQRLQIKFLYGLKDLSLGEELSKEQIIEAICAAYRFRKSPELVKRIDGFIRNDDATMVVWDLLDETGSSPKESDETSAQLAKRGDVTRRKKGAAKKL